jgi:hypothetical protein
VNTSDMPRQRRPRNQLKNAIREFMAERPGETARTVDLTVMLENRFGEVGKSSVRVALQDARYFERVSPGVFLLKA